ncbi:MAG: hypothetical protein AW09_001183 [Candidatus Accumulibacter phosphatis]|uniref:Uncharacterized protein n=1 Tax=Candidatus Accumulibacter phosphatis TaxID=327160 RepID=A0A080M8Z3_9PROT|nr:MAG: hypothetical protein AW09_001183 [Candidatus Accumulibacter phosphatis]
MTGLCGRLQQIVPAQIGERSRARRQGVGIDQDDVPQIMAHGKSRRQQRQTFGRGDERPHIAVAHDVGHLFGLEQRVQRHKDATGGSAAKTRNDGFQPLLEVDGHPLAALQAEANETADETGNGLLELSVAHRLFAVSQRDGVRLTIGRSLDQLMEQACISHFYGMPGQMDGGEF